MVQGNRLLSGVKGFKLLVEEFLQPKMTTAIEAKTKDIAEIKNKLDVVFEDTKNKAKKQEWFKCDKCDGSFKFESELKKHITKHEQDNTVNKRELSTSPSERTKKKIKEDLAPIILPLVDTSVVKKQVTEDPTQLVSVILDVENGGNENLINIDTALEQEASVNPSQKEEDIMMEIDENTEKVEEL